jgi:hypothetical protein
MKENMKTKTNLLLCSALLTLLAFSTAHAQANNTEEFSSKLPVEIQYERTGFRVFLSDYNTDSLHASPNRVTSLVINTWGEDKVMVLFQIEGGFHGCLGTSVNYVGYGTASNTYNLYLQSSSDIPTPQNSKSIGSLMLTDKNAYLHFHDGFAATTTNTRGDCVYSLPADTSIQLKKSTD